MDKYGIINLTELDSFIEWGKEVGKEALITPDVITELCAKNPSAGDCFNAARIIDGVGKDYGYDYSDFNDYITNYKP